MLHVYGASVVGPWHVKSGVPCQDAHAFWVSGDGCLAAAAASDGLGSERFSDIGSKTASEAAVAYCRDHATAGASPKETLKVLRGAYAAAYDAVCDKADEMGESAGEFDETLALALLDGDRLFWGHVGDSGIVAGMADGTYRLVTSMQRDDEGRVFPLCFDDHWQFGVLEGVSTVLLCTDGVLEGMIAPPVLAANSDCPLDRSKARMFLHPLPEDAGHLGEVRSQAATYLETYPAELIDDDKTVVVMFDDAHLPASQPDAYYAEPNWDELMRLRRERLYAPSAPEPSQDGRPKGDSEKHAGSGEKNGGDASGSPDHGAVRTICHMSGAMSRSLRGSAPSLRRAALAAIGAGMAIGRGCVVMAGEVIRSLDGVREEGEGRRPAPPDAPRRPS